MKSSEYKNIFLNEDSHFFYQSTHENIINLLQKFVTSPGQLKILDAGCGTGLLMKKLSNYGEVWGVDLSEHALHFSKKRGLKNIKQSSVLKLPFKNKSFDVVLSVDVLYHQNVGDDIKALEEFHRVLKPNGKVIVKVPAHNWLQGKHDKIVHTKHRYTLLEINDKLQKVGFEVVYISWGHSLFFLFAIVKRVVEKFSSSSEESDVKKIPSFLNQIVILLCKLENLVMVNFNLPIGLSVYAVGAKPQQKGKSRKN